MIRCPDCRSEVSEWAAHCPTCGADVTGAESVEAGVRAGPVAFGKPSDELEHLEPLDEAGTGAPETGVVVGTAGVARPGVVVTTAAPRPRIGERRVRLPAAAAVVVVAAAAAIVLVVMGRHGHPKAAVRPPSSPTTAVTPTVLPPRPTVGPTDFPPVTSGIQSPTTFVPAGDAAPRLVDLTWINDSRGFALVSMGCPAGTCALILTTADGGQTWTRRGNVPDVSVSVASQVCIATCFQHLRYASSTVGYLWGQGGLYLTVDGGQSWVSQPTSQIAALEAVPGYAVRVAAPAGVPGPLEVERSPVGTSQWTHLPTQVGFFGADIFTAGEDLYIAWRGHTAGGAPDAHTTFIRSLDGGATWRSFGDPCGQTSDGSELDASVYAATPNGDLAVLCAPRLVNGTLWYTESSDSGDHFGSLQPVPIESDVTVQLALANSGRVALVASTGGGATQVIRSADGGRSWANVLSAPPPTAQGVAPWLGFEDDTTGRVSFGDTVLWTTTDSGLTWTEEQVPASG